METVWLFIKMPTIDLNYELSIFFLHIYPKEYKSIARETMSTPMFIAALYALAKLWTLHRCPTADQCIKQMWYI
jgi:hypothetical protein